MCRLQESTRSWVFLEHVAKVVKSVPNVMPRLLQVKKKRPGRDGKMAGLVPVLYVSQPWVH